MEPQRSGALPTEVFYRAKIYATCTACTYEINTVDRDGHLEEVRRFFWSHCRLKRSQYKLRLLFHKPFNQAVKSRND